MEYPNDEVTKVHERNKVWSIILCFWGLLFVFTAYDTTAVRDQTQKSEFLAENKGVENVLDFSNRFGELTGLTEIRNVLAQIRSGLNEPYLAFRLPADESETTVPEVVEKAPQAETKPSTVNEKSEIQHRMIKPKRRVLIVGASSIQFAIGAALERQIPKYEGVKVRRFGKLASGLSRPDFFDWPAQIRKLLKEFKPDLMIANFGGNGAQGIPLGKRKSAKFKTPEWDQAYTKRVYEIIDMAYEAGADVAFLGMPNMRSKKFAKKMEYLNRVQKQAAEKKGAVWISSWSWTSDRKGKYRKSIKLGKKRGLMRTSDGIHYSKLGAKFVVGNMLAQLESKYSWSRPNEPVVFNHQFARTSTTTVHTFREYRPQLALQENRVRLWLEFKTNKEVSETCFTPTETELKQFAKSVGAGVFVPADCASPFGPDFTFAEAKVRLLEGLKLSGDQPMTREVVTSADEWNVLKQKMEPAKSSTVSP